MKLRTRVLDGLYLNWALPASGLPEPPPPLRYERHPWQGSEWVFASVLLFRQQGLHLPLVPFVRFSYPQFNLRLYVVDDDGVPSVYFHTVLVPGWVVPAARAVGQLPAAAAHFRYPPPSREVPAGSWEWRVRRGSSLRVEASQSSPMVGVGPPLGSWDDTVRYIRERPRGYAEVAHELRRVDTEQPRVAVWPVAASVIDAGLLADCLPLGRAAGDGGDGDGDGHAAAAGGVGGVGGWPPLHSAWFCPEIPFTFELSVAAKIDLSPRLPQAAASSRSRL
jgi:Uncharacterized conserved protein (COG2071)